MDKDVIRFENCRILRDGKIINDDYLVIRGGKILDYMSVFFDEKLEPNIKIDCQGAILAPGLIDIQINGGFGFDFSNNIENVENGMKIVSEGLLQYGVTGFCPTLVSSSSDVYRKVLPNIKNIPTGAQNLGIHVEGPFINISKKGAHLADNLRNLSGGISDIENMYGNLEGIKIITLAPEIEGADSVIKELSKRNIVVSIGHTDVNLRKAENAVKSGAKLITHLFNAMTSFHHRDPGLLGLLTSECKNSECIYFGLISDGCHTEPEAIRIAYCVKYEGLILVTDAISALGLPDGFHKLGEHGIEIKNGCAYIANTETLCGSICPLNKCAKLFMDFTNCSIVEALEACSLHPAKVLGIADQKGSLSAGYDADITFFNDEFDVLATWIGGRCVFSRDNAYNVIY